MLRSAKAAWLAGALVLTGMAAAPAMAEVKAGVDAWTAGDFATAVREWAGPAAEGDPDAQFNMGQAYRLGRGVETDVAQAEALYARAAAQGQQPAVVAQCASILQLFAGEDRRRGASFRL